MTPIERVARAINKEFRDNLRPVHAELTARAALLAAREAVSETMVAAQYPNASG